MDLLGVVAASQGVGARTILPVVPAGPATLLQAPTGSLGRLIASVTDSRRAASDRASASAPRLEEPLCLSGEAAPRTADKAHLPNVEVHDAFAQPAQPAPRSSLSHMFAVYNKGSHAQPPPSVPGVPSPSARSIVTGGEGAVTGSQLLTPRPPSGSAAAAAGARGIITGSAALPPPSSLLFPPGYGLGSAADPVPAAAAALGFPCRPAPLPPPPSTLASLHAALKMSVTPTPSVAASGRGWLQTNSTAPLPSRPAALGPARVPQKAVGIPNSCYMSSVACGLISLGLPVLSSNGGLDAVPQHVAPFLHALRNVARRLNTGDSVSADLLDALRRASLRCGSRFGGSEQQCPAEYLGCALGEMHSEFSVLAPLLSLVPALSGPLPSPLVRLAELLAAAVVEEPSRARVACCPALATLFSSGPGSCESAAPVQGRKSGVIDLSSPSRVAVDADATCNSSDGGVAATRFLLNGLFTLGAAESVGDFLLTSSAVRAVNQLCHGQQFVLCAMRNYAIQPWSPHISSYAAEWRDTVAASPRPGGAASEKSARASVCEPSLGCADLIGAINCVAKQAAQGDFDVSVDSTATCTACTKLSLQLTFTRVVPIRLPPQRAGNVTGASVPPLLSDLIVGFTDACEAVGRVCEGCNGPVTKSGTTISAVSRFFTVHLLRFSHRRGGPAAGSRLMDAVNIPLTMAVPVSAGASSSSRSRSSVMFRLKVVILVNGDTPVRAHCTVAADGVGNTRRPSAWRRFKGCVESPIGDIEQFLRSAEVQRDAYVVVYERVAAVAAPLPAAASCARATSTAAVPATEAAAEAHAAASSTLLAEPHYDAARSGSTHGTSAWSVDTECAPPEASAGHSFGLKAAKGALLAMRTAGVKKRATSGCLDLEWLQPYSDFHLDGLQPAWAASAEFEARAVVVRLGSISPSAVSAVLGEGSRRSDERHAVPFLSAIHTSYSEPAALRDLVYEIKTAHESGQYYVASLLLALEMVHAVCASGTSNPLDQLAAGAHLLPADDDSALCTTLARLRAAIQGVSTGAGSGAPAAAPPVAAAHENASAGVFNSAALIAAIAARFPLIANDAFAAARYCSPTASLVAEVARRLRSSESVGEALSASLVALCEGWGATPAGDAQQSVSGCLAGVITAARFEVEVAGPLLMAAPELLEAPCSTTLRLVELLAMVALDALGLPRSGGADDVTLPALAQLISPAHDSAQQAGLAGQKRPRKAVKSGSGAGASAVGASVVRGAQSLAVAASRRRGVEGPALRLILRSLVRAAAAPGAATDFSAFLYLPEVSAALRKISQGQSRVVSAIASSVELRVVRGAMSTWGLARAISERSARAPASDAGAQSAFNPAAFARRAHFHSVTDVIRLPDAMTVVAPCLAPGSVLLVVIDDTISCDNLGISGFRIVRVSKIDSAPGGGGCGQALEVSAQAVGFIREFPCTLSPQHRVRVALLPTAADALAARVARGASDCTQEAAEVDLANRLAIVRASGLVPYACDDGVPGSARSALEVRSQVLVDGRPTADSLAAAGGQASFGTCRASMQWFVAPDVLESIAWTKTTALADLLNPGASAPDGIPATYGPPVTGIADAARLQQEAFDEQDAADDVYRRQRLVNFVRTFATVPDRFSYYSGRLEMQPALSAAWYAGDFTGCSAPALAALVAFAAKCGAHSWESSLQGKEGAVVAAATATATAAPAELQPAQMARAHARAASSSAAKSLCDALECTLATQDSTAQSGASLRVISVSIGLISPSLSVGCDVQSGLVPVPGALPSGSKTTASTSEPMGTSAVPSEFDFEGMVTPAPPPSQSPLALAASARVESLFAPRAAPVAVPQSAEARAALGLELIGGVPFRPSMQWQLRGPANHSIAVATPSTIAVVQSPALVGLIGRSLASAGAGNSDWQWPATLCVQLRRGVEAGGSAQLGHRVVIPLELRFGAGPHPEAVYALVCVTREAGDATRGGRTLALAAGVAAPGAIGLWHSFQGWYALRVGDIGALLESDEVQRTADVLVYARARL